MKQKLFGPAINIARRQRRGQADGQTTAVRRRRLSCRSAANGPGVLRGSRGLTGELPKVNRVLVYLAQITWRSDMMKNRQKKEKELLGDEVCAVVPQVVLRESCNQRQRNRNIEVACKQHEEPLMSYGVYLWVHAADIIELSRCKNEAFARLTGSDLWYLLKVTTERIDRFTPLGTFNERTNGIPLGVRAENVLDVIASCSKWNRTYISKYGRVSACSGGLARPPIALQRDMIRVTVAKCDRLYADSAVGFASPPTQQFRLSPLYLLCESSEIPLLRLLIYSPFMVSPLGLRVFMAVMNTIFLYDSHVRLSRISCRRSRYVSSAAFPDPRQIPGASRPDPVIPVNNARRRRGDRARDLVRPHTPRRGIPLFRRAKGIRGANDHAAERAAANPRNMECGNTWKMGNVISFPRAERARRRENTRGRKTTKQRLKKYAGARRRPDAEIPPFSALNGETLWEI
ncbi:hypothetical protein EVAR_9339_1 [Eumeta japonica]|uniref:Uncharacterized protein n=1 Tax=Eumeta variegata TaxID=151549 RepID=A0A4C1YTM9_EUMVA|nr:hypothetical protein EVAR_9339_1 [Eumeta japonica]